MQQDPGSTLRQCMEQGYLTPLSYFFACFLARRAGQGEDSELALTAALVSERNQRGDVCVELDHFAGQPLFAGDDSSARALLPVAPELDAWCRALARAGDCVGGPGDHQPLVLHNRRVYLGRSWQDEFRVARSLERRLSAATDTDFERLREGLQRLFPPSASANDRPDWQKVASALAVSRLFAVISGGPGTGKTTTVLRVLALLLEQNPDMRIRLAAPTGKAAARMVESIRGRKQEAGLAADLLERIPDEAVTLHRLLGYGGRGGFRHQADNPLALDCLVVDEASMIDLGMMARLLEALPERARLILLGDREQLASVDAGNVLGDITGRGREPAWRLETGEWLEELTGSGAGVLPVHPDAPPVADAVALLRSSYRFSDSGGIGRLARLVNRGEGREALALLQQESAGEGAGELQWMAPRNERLNPGVLQWAAERYRRYLECGQVDEALRHFDETRILCAVHEGESGARRLNERVEEQLRAGGLIGGGHEYRGKPVMITSNDYELQLFNGDIGLLWPDGKGHLRAWFPGTDAGLRSVPINTLPEHVPAWALTVHKSQGSEFGEILLVLPADANSPLLSRELLYTGITRARSAVIMHSNEAAFLGACQRRVRRSSGLADALWSP